jgi:hypothetical protein
VTRKLITPEEGYGKAIDKAGMDMTMKRAGIDPSKFVAAAAAQSSPGGGAQAPAGTAGAPARPSPAGVPRS